MATGQHNSSRLELGELGELVNGRPISRRSLLKGAAALGAAAALGPIATACGGSSGSSASSSPSGGAGTAKKGGTIRSAIGGGSAKDSLEAQAATTETQIAMQWQIYDALMGWNEKHQLQMLLADSYDVNSDATQYTVKLKSGLTFHNGKPVTADDVVFSFKRILAPDSVAIGKDTLADLTPSGIKKVDDLTVQFNLERSNVTFYEALALYNNAVVPIDYDPKDITGAIGTGPWKIVQYEAGQQAEFDANPDYWGEGPYADKLVMSEFADPTAKANALMSGEVDYMTLLDSSQVAVLQGTPGMQVLKSETGGWYPFTMRIDQKPFDDVRVRQAFRLLVDREQMIQQAMGGYAWLGNDMYAPYDPGYPKDLSQRSPDIEQAKSLLKQAGYDNNLTVELVTSTAVAASAPLAAQVFAEQAKAAGVTVKVKKVDPSIFYGDDYLSWPFAQDFWATRNYLPQVQVGSLPTAPYNETHWKDDEWQALIDQALMTVDDAARNDLVRQAMTIEHDRGGYIVWQFNVLLDAYSDKLAGVVPDTFGAVSANRCRFNLMYFA